MGLHFIIKKEQMRRFNLKKFPVENKVVLLRVDYNVPLHNNKILDNTKIIASLPTIKYLLSKNCQIIIATHLGNPKGKVVNELKTDPLAKELKKLLKVNVTKIDDCLGKEVKEKINKAKTTKIFFLENLRFYRAEEKNNHLFAHSLASLADFYVNDAFAVSHRKHASIEAITHFLPSLAGFLLEKEIFYLNNALKPRRPVVWIMGGAKLDKVQLIKKILRKTDQILIGGALAFSFLKAKGIKVGMSKVDSNSVSSAKKLLKKWSAKKIILPLDFIVSEKFSPQAKSKIVNYNQIKNNQIALDLGPRTVELFKKQLSKANTIVWNGPLGYFEWAKYAFSTKAVGRFLGKLESVKICGGGETAEAVNKFHLAHNFTHLSTGGGATLTFLAGNKLVGITALEKNYQKFRKKARLIRVI
jgi:3-phosphoglycerate kinase